MKRKDFFKGVAGILALAILPKSLSAIGNNKKVSDYTIRNRSDGETSYAIERGNFEWDDTKNPVAVYFVRHPKGRFAYHNPQSVIGIDPYRKKKND